MRRNAIITGSNRGIGKAILSEFAHNGYDVWACARKKSQEFETYIKELAKETDSVITPVYFDLLHETEIKKD